MGYYKEWATRGHLQPWRAGKGASHIRQFNAGMGWTRQAFVSMQATISQVIFLRLVNIEQ